MQSCIFDAARRHVALCVDVRAYVRGASVQPPHGRADQSGGAPMTPSLPPDGAERPVTRVLAEIAHILVPADEIEERLRQALGLLGQLVPYDRSALVEIGPDGATRIHLCPEPPSETPSVEPALLRLLALVTELGTWRGTLGEATDGTSMDTWPSYLAVPLVGADGVGGLLLVGQHAANAYAED